MKQHWIHGPLPHCEETNVVFFRGMSSDAITRGLLAQRRVPLAYGKGAEWGVVMHDLFGWNDDDYELAHYGRLCAAGGELVVFVTEPCIAKGHGPQFEYYRDGRLIAAFSFEAPYNIVGEDPDLLLPALTAARLVGPHAEFDGGDFEERQVRTIEGFFDLPEIDLPELEMPLSDFD